MRIQAFHSRLGMFYHDNDDCPFARTIKPASRRDGESGLGLCMLCRSLDKEDDEANDSHLQQAQLQVLDDDGGAQRHMQEDKLEASFLKQNFGPHPGRDMQGNPVTPEEQQLIDQDLRHLHMQAEDAKPDTDRTDDRQNR